MKPPWEWEEEDLRGLIGTGTQESIDLDYKTCAALRNTDRKKDEVSKDVSAFANSAGGTIVYGMIENGHVPTAIDSGYDPGEISKEWLDQVIGSRIHPRIDGVRIKQVQLTTHAPDRVAYVVHIPQSFRAPHQASDKRFYKRANFQSVPMEEYEIRDIANRREGPSLNVKLALAAGEKAKLLFGDESTHSEPFELVARITNESACPAEYAVVIVCVDPRLLIVSKGDCTDMGYIAAGGIEYQALQVNWSPNMKMPIWRGLALPLTNEPIKIAVPRGAEPKPFIVQWQAHSPRMAVKRGFGVLVRDGMEVTLQTLAL